MAYATVDELKMELGNKTAVDDALLAAKLADAQKYIESDRLRSFEAVTATRYYDSSAVDGYDLLLDADLLTVTTLINGNGVVLDSTTYQLIPRNESPKHIIRLKENYAWDFTNSDSVISVTGTWGYTATPPADIKQACIRLAAYLYRLKDAQVFDVTASPELGVITIPQGIPKDVRRILDNYPKRAGMGAL